MNPAVLLDRAARRRRALTTRLVAAAATSAVGDGLADVALGLLAVSITDDPRLVSGVFVAGRLPWLVLGHPIAAMVDRRRRPAPVMLLADGVRAVALAAIAALVFTGHVSIWMLYVTAMVVGAGEIAHGAAANALLPAIAEGAMLTRANGYLGAAESGGYAVTGPAVGGAVYALGRTVPFALDAASFAASGVLLRPLRSVEIERDETSDDAPRPPGLLRYVLAHRLLRILLVQLVSLGLAQAMVLSLLPVYGRRTLGLSAGVYGAFLGATAVGNVVGGLAAPRLWRNRRHTTAFIVGSGLAMGGTYVAVAYTHQPVVAGLLLAIDSTAVGVLNTVSPTLRMEHAPANARGRVSTLFTQSIFIAQPLGALASGLLARRYGVTTSFATAGAVMIATMLLTDHPLRRAVREVGA